MPLLHWAALKGFWSAPMSSARRLAKQDLDVELTGSDADDLVTTCRCILKGDDLLAMQCLDHRVIEIENSHCTAIDDIPMSEEGRECIESVEATKAEIKTLTANKAEGGKPPPVAAAAAPAGASAAALPAQPRQSSTGVHSASARCAMHFLKSSMPCRAPAAAKNPRSCRQRPPHAARAEAVRAGAYHSSMTLW